MSSVGADWEARPGVREPLGVAFQSFALSALFLILAGPFGPWARNPGLQWVCSDMHSVATPLLVPTVEKDRQEGVWGFLILWELSSTKWRGRLPPESWLLWDAVVLPAPPKDSLGAGGEKRDRGGNTWTFTLSLSPGGSVLAP